MSKRGINRRVFIKTSAAGMVGAGLMSQAPLLAADTDCCRSSWPNRVSRTPSDEMRGGVRGSWG